MNQGKSEVTKQEMARVNIYILGISELKYTGMGEFNSEDHYIYHCGQESLRRNGVAIIVNKRVWNAVLGCNLKNDTMISVHFKGKPFNITIIQVYVPTIILAIINNAAMNILIQVLSGICFSVLLSIYLGMELLSHITSVSIFEIVPKYCISDSFVDYEGCSISFKGSLPPKTDLWDHPRRMGHDGEFWENVVQWRREWQTSSVFLPWEPHEQCEKARRYDSERWTPQLSRCPICYWRSVEWNRTSQFMVQYPHVAIKCCIDSENVDLCYSD